MNRRRHSFIGRLQQPLSGTTLGLSIGHLLGMLQRTPCKTKKKPGVCCVWRDGERENLRNRERGGAVLERERKRERELEKFLLQGLQFRYNDTCLTTSPCSATNKYKITKHHNIHIVNMND